MIERMQKKRRKKRKRLKMLGKKKKKKKGTSFFFFFFFQIRPLEFFSIPHSFKFFRGASHFCLKIDPDGVLRHCV